MSDLIFRLLRIIIIIFFLNSLKIHVQKNVLRCRPTVLSRKRKRYNCDISSTALWS